MNCFQLLPDEINVHILGYLSQFSDFRKVNTIPGLAHILNWEFWRKKSLQDFKVPFWYFDLPIQQKRKLVGEQRFLEIHSKFKLIPESLARIENKRVEGIYNNTVAKSISKKRRDIEFLSYLMNRTYPTGRYEKIKLEKVALKAQLKKIGICQGKTCKLIDVKLLFNSTVEYDEYVNEAGKILESSKEFNFKQTPAYCFPSLILLVQAAILVLQGRKQDFHIVKEAFINLNRSSQNVVLNFALVSRNVDHFIQLWKLSPPMNIEVREFLYHKAYFCANIEVISFLQNQKISPRFDLSIQCLAAGFAFDPHSVEVYQILRDAKGKFSTLELCHEAFRLDLDIRILLNFRFEGENCLTNFNSDISSLRYFALIESQSTSHFFDRHAHSSVIRKKLYAELGISVKFRPKKQPQGIPLEFLKSFLENE